MRDTNDGFVFVGGICSSNNYGASWSVSNANSGNQWYGLGVDSTGQYWVACAIDGLYRSSDYAATWTKVYGLSGSGAQSCDSDTSGQYLVANDHTTGNVYSSSDYGSSWSTAAPIPNAGRLISDETGQVVSLACNSGALYQSNDYGNTFWPIESSERPWTAIYMSPSCK